MLDKTDFTVFLTLVLRKGDKSITFTGCFTPRVRIPGTHLIGSWVGLRASKEIHAISQPVVN